MEVPAPVLPVSAIGKQNGVRAKERDIVKKLLAWKEFKDDMFTHINPRLKMPTISLECLLDFTDQSLA